MPPISIFAQQSLSLKKTAAVLLVAMILMLLDSKNPDWFTPVRDTSHAAMQPIYQMSVFPNFVSHWAEGTMMSKESLRRENVQLHAQLLHAQAKLQQQDYVLAQNARLQGILSTTKPDQYDLNLAQVIGTDTNPLKQIVVINKGSKDGVEVGQTAIDENGILGQIINVYPNTSRLLLITDELQSVSVTVRRTGQRAIVTGEGSPSSLKLDYIFKTSDIRLGDELISSGLGGRFPAGYRVGRVEYINPEQNDNFMNIEVAPAADFINSSYVLIMQDSKNAPSYTDDNFTGSLELTHAPYVPVSRPSE
ncbi:rod shape-determining protein MreC [Psychrobacter sp. FDAARGOS_221]|uniref:rod shape-determining protein MreC n=1 Tax=Psychrobacter sp. FDAARGOS_221 TaxID=1975705 RepID=UPI000BB572D3|nr:rod shape-determining protein MreC [Psychrobacter sp. FDAARGOS_221]PNK60335.1 rod shape-determining protein MreC [Psychrobacter sp. FDAARGOS_221]